MVVHFLLAYLLCGRLKSQGSLEMFALNIKDINQILGEEHSRVKDMYLLGLDKLFGGLDAMHNELKEINQQGTINDIHEIIFFDEFKEHLPETIRLMSVISDNDIAESDVSFENVVDLTLPPEDMAKEITHQLDLVSRKNSAESANLFDAYHSPTINRANIFHLRSDKVSVFGVRASFTGHDVLSSEQDNLVVSNYKRKHTIQGRSILC